MNEPFSFFCYAYGVVTMEETKTETESFLKFQQQDKILLDDLEVTGLTTLNNISFSDDFKNCCFEEFRSYFLVDTLEEVYVFRENQKIKYGKDIIETALTNFLGFYYERKLTWKTLIKNSYLTNNLVIYFNPKEPMPIIFCIKEEAKNSPCLIVAPRITTEP